MNIMGGGADVDHINAVTDWDDMSRADYERHLDQQASERLNSNRNESEDSEAAKIRQ